jgi:uncharacterized oxidoreductase
MEMSGNTILITGGTSGIGLALATKFLELHNTVIVTGRNQDKLDETKKKLSNVHTIRSDASDPKAIVALFEQVTKDFPDLNILVNNAGIMRKINLHDEGGDLADITREIDINLSAPIHLVKQFLPHLKSKPAAAIINVSSGLAFVPLPISPVYCATKAGLHSFTESLRVQLKHTKVKVFELAPPATETKLLRGEFASADLGDVKTMDVNVLADHAINGLRKDVLEIRPGQANALKFMSRFAPGFILKQLAKSADLMLAQKK